MSQIQLWPDWKIVREIGSGSFGNVYEIHRQNGPYLERSALKVIRVPQNPAELEQLHMDGLGDEDTESYLQRYVDDIRSEIGLMQQFVGYSNIVSYEDYLIRKHEDTVGWDILIRMELLTALPDYMASHPLSERDVIRLGLDISQALVICHGAGIIHRDIKPQNIFVNKRGFFKLGDFGISRPLPGSGSVLSFKGSVPYMAPETFAMRDTDARSDIYSLALVLYRILNGGREPFLSSSKFTPGEREEAQRRRLAGERLPMPAGGSRALCAVLAKALSADPAARYQTAAQFHAALQEAARETGPAVSGSPGSRGSRAAERAAAAQENRDRQMTGGRDEELRDRRMAGGREEGNQDRWMTGGSDQETRSVYAGPAGRDTAAVRGPVRGQTTLDLHDMRQGGSPSLEDQYPPGMIRSDPPRQQREYYDSPYYGSPLYGSGAGGGSASHGSGRRNGSGRTRTIVLLAGAVAVLLLLLAAVSMLLLNSSGKNSTAVSAANPAGGDGETASARELSGDEGGSASVQDLDNAGQADRDQEKADPEDPQVSPAGQETAEVLQDDDPVLQEEADVNPYPAGSAGAGGADASAYNYTELVEYEVECRDADGNLLREKIESSGLQGHMIIVDAPEIAGYSPREDSISVYLSGDEEENVVTFVYDARGNIPDSALHYNNHSYYAYVSSDVDSFWEAVSICEDMGGYMAVINDDGENRALYEYVFDRLGLPSAYFGYTDDGSEGYWYWAGDDSSGYENWAGGQPDNQIHNGKSENYALFYYKDGRYKWNDGDFGPNGEGNVIFLIEWDW